MQLRRSPSTHSAACPDEARSAAGTRPGCPVATEAGRSLRLFFSTSRVARRPIFAPFFITVPLLSFPSTSSCSTDGRPLLLVARPPRTVSFYYILFCSFWLVYRSWLAGRPARPRVLKWDSFAPALKAPRASNKTPLRFSLPSSSLPYPHHPPKGFTVCIFFLVDKIPIRLLLTDSPPRLPFLSLLSNRDFDLRFSLTEQWRIHQPNPRPL